MIPHLLPPHRRAIGYIVPGIIVMVAAYMFPVFIAAGRAWWPVFILAPAAALAVQVCVEWRAMAISFDPAGVHYRTVGYRLDVPWSGIVFQANGGKPVLRVTEGRRQFFPWLGMMFSILSLLNPLRASHASHLITSIPLYYFMTADTDAVMAELRAAAPAGLL